jgi:putative membrane protein
MSKSKWLNPEKESVYMKVIAVLSIVIPVAVAFLLFVPQTGAFGDLEVSALPKLNATLNTIATFFLVSGFLFIINKKILLHKICMWSAFSVSSLFLVSYVIYHTQAESTHFGGEGFVKYFYFTLLITHIITAIAIVPLVLITIYRSVTGQLAKHKKIARYTLPLWLYVTITGVVVYLMISPYYV